MMLPDVIVCGAGEVLMGKGQGLIHVSGVGKMGMGGFGVCRWWIVQGFCPEESRKF